MENLRWGVLCLVTWFLFPHISGAEEFLYLPITRTPVITVGFCGYRNPSGSCHGGIDYDVRDDGDGIFAAAEGVVEIAEDGWVNTYHGRRVYGNYVQIRHNNGYHTIYGHLKIGTLEVGVGDEVRAGELLGTGDNSGWSTGSHLHFEARDASGHKIDPYGESPAYPNCGANRLWVNCPPTAWVDEDSDGDTWTVSEGDCDDTNADIHPGATELCNSLDDDCDSETDETWPLIGDACTFRPTPLCERTGVWVCEPLHRGTICEGDHEVRAERCNSFDDDCDGEVDEDWPLLGVACEGGFGECRASGVWECEPLVGGSICSADIGTPSPELCDSLDNDCDRETDEDWPELGLACGTSPCGGSYICTTEGLYTICEEIPSTTEVCDGVDNDCDGETDETPAELACADTNDCTEDVCFFGLCQNVARDRDGDTYADDLCGGSDCDDLNPAAWEYIYDQRVLAGALYSASNSPSLVWTGIELGVAWVDWRYYPTEIYFARVNSSLTEIGSDVRITTAAEQSDFPTLVWTGSEYALAWSDWRSTITRDIYFTRIDSVGRKVIGDIQVTAALNSTSSYEPSLVWTGTEFGVVFTNGENGDIYFARFAASGDEIGSELAIAADPAIQECCPKMVWTGTAYGLVWNASVSGGQEVRFSRFTSTGSPIGGVTVVESLAEMGDPTYPDLVWNGSIFSLVWTGNTTGNYEIYLGKVNESGAVIGAAAQLTNTVDLSRHPTLVWNGVEYGLFWQEVSSTYERGYLMRVDRDGRRLSSEILFSPCPYHERPSLVWTGHEYIPAWADCRGPDMYREIFLGRLGCGW